MKESTRKLLDKAERAIEAAESQMRAGFLDFAVARAYYAMFYIAEALLSERGMSSRKHSGVHAAFGEHFVKPGLFDPRFHRWLLDGFDQRIQADYGVDAVMHEVDVRTMIEQAREFLSESQRHLGQA